MQNEQQNVASIIATTRSLFTRFRSDSLLRNSLFIMATTVISSLLGYIYWAVATHTFQASEVGLASAVISMMTLTSILSNLGFGSALVQMLPRRQSGSDWSSLLNFALIASCLTSLLGGLVAMLLLLRSPQFADLTRNNFYVGAFLASVPLWTVTTLIDSTFTAERSTNHMLARNLIFSVLKIALLGLFALLRVQGLAIFLSWIAAAFISLIASFLLVRRLGRGYSLTLGSWRQHTRSLFAVLMGNHLINLGGALPMYLLPVIVTDRLSAADNAYFYVAWMLGSQFSLISVAVAASLFAEGSYTTRNILGKMRSSFLITGALLVPAMAVFFVLGSRILGIFGAAYPQRGTPLLMLLTAAAVFDATTSLYVSVLRVQKRLWGAAFLNTLMGVLTVGLTWVFLPSMGISGAGLAWLIAQGTGTALSAVDYLITRQNLEHLETPIESPAVTETAVS